MRPGKMGQREGEAGIAKLSAMGEPILNSYNVNRGMGRFNRWEDGRMSSPPVEVVTRLPRMQPRPADSNKGTFGRVLVVAGSRGMSGAAVLCGSAALRGGAGLVYVAVPESIQSIVAAGNPCYLTEPLAEDPQGRVAASCEPSVMATAAKMSAVAFGPGLGNHRGTVQLALSLTTHCSLPLVIDADGLNAMAEHTDRLHRDRMAGPRILTPHPGEFARLLGSDVPQVQANRRELAVKFAAEHGVVLLLKGFGTIVTDGHRVYVNPTGNPGMATGGTGDVLTGLIAALLAQGMQPFDAAQLGAYWHGLAGDLARDELGEMSLIASDLLHYLPRAIRQGG
jgi:NAD(P)H-hydrate epimerase